MERYNTALAFNCFHLVRDLPGSLRSINALLTPGGLLISKTTCALDYGFSIICIPMFHLMRAVRIAPLVALFSADGLMKQMVAAGFEIVTSEYHMTGTTNPRLYVVAKKVVA
jgi:hypothetical protein